MSPRWHGLLWAQLLSPIGLRLNARILPVRFTMGAKLVSLTDATEPGGGRGRAGRCRFRGRVPDCRRASGGAKPSDCRARWNVSGRVFKRIRWIGAPHVWGRAAYLGRSGQSIFEPSEARLEIYVYDPLVAFKGEVTQRTLRLTVPLFWWLSLGPEVSWTKAQRGSRGNHIGAEIRWALPLLCLLSSRVSSSPRSLTTLIRDGAISWTGMTTHAHSRILADRAWWAAGFFPWLEAALDPIWVVLAEYLTPRMHLPSARIARR